MYLNIKSKYKKLFWLLIGFCIASMFTTKAKAWSDISEISLPSGVSPLTHNIIITNGTSPSASSGYRAWFQSKTLNQVFYLVGSGTFPYYSSSFGGISVRSSYSSSTPLTGQCTWYWANNNFSSTPQCLGTSGQVLNRGGSVIWTNAPVYNSSSGGIWFNPYVINFNLNGGEMWSDYSHTISYSTTDFQNSFVDTSSAMSFISSHYMTNSDLTFQGWYYDSEFTQPFSTDDEISHNITLYAKFTNTLPDYLNGYKKISFTSQDRYYMLSGISEGYVYIPTQAFLDYGGRLSYYDNDLESQPYTSYIQDYIIMPDGDYVRQSFNLSNYEGADWVMFSKYIYLEGEDNISYDIYVPDDTYDSLVEIIPNTQGGNNFDFEYKDNNGDIQSGQTTSTDLSQNSPLLGNIFSDFSSNTFGLTSIITAPLGLISSLSSSSCSSLNLPIPYLNSNLSLPCMTTIYQNNFGSFFALYQSVTFGIVAYWVIVKIFNLVKDAKNPDHDEIEVIDL